MRQIQSHWRLVALVTAMLMVVGAGIGYAAIPSANGTITACVKKNGTMRLIDVEAGGACNARQETRLTWGQTGPQGVQGLPGPKGDQGSPGELGIGIYTVIGEGVEVPADGGRRVEVVGCTGQGDIATGGGFEQVSGAGLDWAYSASYPRGEPSPRGWTVIAENFTSGPQVFKAHVVCMHLEG